MHRPTRLPPRHGSPASAWRVAVLLATTVLAVAALIFNGPIAQDEAYHQFADRRMLLGIPHLWNVATNLPFALVGGYGLLLVGSRSFSSGLLAQLRPAYIVVFVGLLLLAPASAWYHLDPSSDTLLWDRVPITLVFMALFSAIVGEHVDARLSRRALPHLLLLGLASLLWWRASGDLRLYVLVQFLPLLLAPLIMLMYSTPLPSRHWLWAMFAVYVLAKLAEAFDGPIYHAIGISGHSLKHLAAALAVGLVVLRLRRCSRPAPAA